MQSIDWFVIAGYSGILFGLAWFFNGRYPWLSMLVCAPVIVIWCWRGAIFASFLKLLPVFIFIIPGMICFALGQSGMAAELNQALIDPATGSRKSWGMGEVAVSGLVMGLVLCAYLYFRG